MDPSKEAPEIIEDLVDAQPSWKSAPQAPEYDRSVPGMNAREYQDPVTKIGRNQDPGKGGGDVNVLGGRLWWSFEADGSRELTVSNYGSISLGAMYAALTLIDNATGTGLSAGGGEYIFLKALASVFSGSTSIVTLEVGATWTGKPSLVEVTGSAPNETFVAGYYPLAKWSGSSFTILTPDCCFMLQSVPVASSAGYLVQGGIFVPAPYVL